MSAPEGVYDVALKPKLLRSLLREYVPDEKHPFNPSELSYVVSAVKTHKLLSERTPQSVEQDVVDAWKSSVDSWVNRLLTLSSSNLPDKCWAGICLLGLTCQECSSERFLTSYAVWLMKLLPHIQPSAVSHLVRAASCASLSDMFTRLSRYSNAKKDATSQAAKVTHLATELLKEDSSAVVLEGAIGLICTIINFFPLSVNRHYDNVEAVIVSKLISGKCCDSVLKKLGYGLSLLPKSKGDEESWCLMMDKILLYVNSQLNDAFQGLEEEDRSAQTMRALLPPGKEPPPLLGGLAVSEQNSDLSTRRPERLLGSRISTLLQCCCNMLTSSYPVMVPVPTCGLIAVARRVLLVDGYLSLSSYSFMTMMKQEFICSEIPLLQLRSLEILQAVTMGLSSQLLPHVAPIVELLQEYLRRCKFPDLKIKAYSVLKVLLISMGVGLAVHVSQDIVSNIIIDLDFLGDEKDGRSSGTNTKVQPELLGESLYKKRKLSTMAGSQELPAHDGLEAEMTNMTPIPVKIAALEALEALLTVGGSIRSENWRGNIDHHLISVASSACKGGVSKEDRQILLSGDSTSIWVDFQLAALRALLASPLSPGRVRPSHLALALEPFRRGTQGTGTNSFQRSSQFSQTGVERINLADDFEAAAEVPPNAPAPQKTAYSDEENVLLASCWIDISTDYIVGNDQRADQMWSRIAEAYNTNTPEGSIYRAPSTLKSHYYTIQKCSREFNNCYIQVRNSWGSGCNDADIEDKAHVQYKAQHNGKSFKYIKAWRVLKDCPKFLERGDVRGSKKTRVSAAGEYVVTSNTESSERDEVREEPPRPMERNAARRKGKGKGKATTSAGGLGEEYLKRLQHMEELNKSKVKVAAGVLRAKNHKILMKDTSKMTEEQLCIHLQIVEEIKKDMGI